jgi:hypothetical protein
VGPVWSITPGIPPRFTPRLKGIFISDLRWRYPEMRSLSLQVMGNCYQASLTEQNKRSLSLAPQVPTKGLPPFSHTPPHTQSHPQAPQHLWPPKEASPWESVRTLLLATTRKTSSGSRPGVRAVWCGLVGGHLPGARGRGPSCLGSLLTPASP